MLTGGPSYEAMLAELPRSLLEYRAWLKGRGEPGPEGSAWHVSKSHDGAALEAGGRDPCYASDLFPLTVPEFERFLRHARLAQEDLLKSAADLPDELLDWLPQGLLPEHADPWAPDARSMRGILTHALQLEVFYREALKDGRAAGIFEPVRDAAEETAQTLGIIKAAAERDLNRVFHPTRGDGPAGDWAIRKVLRRLISHDRAHAAEIVQRRTWLLLGVPRST